MICEMILLRNMGEIIMSDELLAIQRKMGSTDDLLNRIRYCLLKRGEEGASVKTLMNRLKCKEQNKLYPRLNYLVDNKMVSIREARVYKGLPVYAYVWIGEIEQ